MFVTEVVAHIRLLLLNTNQTKILSFIVLIGRANPYSLAIHSIRSYMNENYSITEMQLNIVFMHCYIIIYFPNVRLITQALLVICESMQHAMYQCQQTTLISAKNKWRGREEKKGAKDST